MLNGNPVLNDLDSSDRLIVLEVVNKVIDMTEMSKVLTVDYNTFDLYVYVLE